MDQTKTNVNNTSPNDEKELSPFSSGSTTPTNNSNSITWLVSRSESSQFPSFWYQRFNLLSYAIFKFLSCVTWKVNLFHLTFFSERVSASQSKWRISFSPQKLKFLFLYSLRLNLFEYMGLLIAESSYNIYFLYSNYRTSMGERSFNKRK